MAKSQRSTVILSELDSAFTSYAEAKRRLDSAQTAFTAAREKFAVIRRLAEEILPTGEWVKWTEAHGDVQYAGKPIAEAIQAVLQRRAVFAALDHFTEEKPFRPAMTVAQLVEELESGGFEFTSATPGREVNATLINLKGVKKIGTTYQIADADEVFQSTEEMLLEGKKK